MIYVALIEDNRLVRDGITALLGRYPDIAVVAAGSGLAPSFVKDADPHVVLLDLGLEDSLGVARGVMKHSPGARLIVMDLLPAQEEIMEFVEAGVAGFIMKDATLEEVVESIRSVAAGNDVLPSQVTTTLFSEIVREALANGESDVIDAVRMTPREREIVDLIGEGLSNKSIASRLQISPHTVKSHLRNIMEKLALHTRLQIAAYAHGREAAS